jgi:predicted transcriptional regulator
VGEVRAQVAESGYDLCVVVDEQRVVAGLLRGDALAKDLEAVVEEVMDPGPRTIRPSIPVEKLLQKRSSEGVKSWIVSTSHGVLLGVLTRDDAERALAAT